MFVVVFGVGFVVAFAFSWWGCVFCWCLIFDCILCFVIVVWLGFEVCLGVFIGLVVLLFVFVCFDVIACAMGWVLFVCNCWVCVWVWFCVW